jgi:hypothetical protein
MPRARTVFARAKVQIAGDLSPVMEVLSKEGFAFDWLFGPFARAFGLRLGDYAADLVVGSLTIGHAHCGELPGQAATKRPGFEAGNHLPILADWFFHPRWEIL